MKRGTLLLAVGLWLAIPCRAQSPPPTAPPAAATPRWVGHAEGLAGNVAIGGLTAGMVRLLKGGSLADAFAWGALGGLVTYAGKMAVVQRFTGAGLLGREVHAVGVSLVRNAADGMAPLSRLFLPLGPLPVRAALALGGGGGVRVRARLDVADAAWLARGLLASGTHLAVGESFSSGMPVFEAAGRWLEDADHGVRGFAVSRAVFLGDAALYPTSAIRPSEVLAHERVHVLQEDFILTAWSDPLCGAALDRLAAGRWVERWAVVDALGWVPGMMSRLSLDADGRDDSPAEREARFLAGH